MKREGDPFVADWLRDAERIARSNEWDGSQKLKLYDKCSTLIVLTPFIELFKVIEQIS